MIELTQNQIVDLFVEKMKQHGSSHSGTYNKADPTHFEKGAAELGMASGFTYSEGDNLGNPEMPCPECENVTVNWHDVTWGVEFEIKTSAGIEKGYWSRPIFGATGEWFRTTEKFFEVFKRIFLEGNDKDFWIADDCAAAMGFYER